MSDRVQAEIQRRLAAVERDEGVRILLAIESGSRAWGFASLDSDYDVRFIYAHPAPWYVAIDLEERRDVIERPITDDIDLNGWDLRKALRLYWKSNPTFAEWLRSPIVYLERGDFAATARALMPAVYSLEAGLYHYRSMAKTNYLTHLRGALVKPKKYFYTLRPLLAVRWLERCAQAPPIEFERLLPMLGDEPELREAIDALLVRKRAAAESATIAPVACLQDFIEAELARLDALAPARSPRTGARERLNELFTATLAE